jgi:chemotaxis protein MotB
VRANPFDPSNRRISILVKNEGGAAPLIPAVNGTVQQAAKPPTPGPAQSGEAKKKAGGA